LGLDLRATTLSPTPKQWAFGVCLGTFAGLCAVTPGWEGKLAACLLMILAAASLWVLAQPNRWLLVFFVTAWLLPPLPIHLGDSGPHVAVLLALAGLMSGALRIYAWRFQADLITAVFLALPAVFLASAATAAILSGSSVATGSLARVALFSIAIFAFLYIRSGPFDADSRSATVFVRTLFIAAGLSAVFACLDFYFQFPAPAGFAEQFVWLSSGVFRRAQGVFYEASTLGNLCTFFLDMIAAALFMPREVCPLPKPWLVVAGLPLMAALVLSYSRASALALVIGLVLLCWLRRDSFPVRRYLAFGVVFCVVPALVLVRVVPSFAETYWARLYNSFAYFGASPDSILSGRLRSWDTLIGFLATHPWHMLFGIGFKTLPYTEFAGVPVIADNTYLSALIETGFIGLILLILLNILILKYAYRASQSMAIHKRFYGSWMLCFWAGEAVQMFSGDLLTYWRVLPAYFCIFALALRAES
jgi:O-antigen ligase